MLYVLRQVYKESKLIMTLTYNYRLGAFYSLH